MVQPGRLQKAM